MLFARKIGERTQPLREHLNDVFSFMNSLLERNRIKVDPTVVKLIAFLHDCGKADKKWQENYPNVSNFPHSLLGLPILSAIAKKLNLNDRIETLLASIIVSHHRTLHEDLYSAINTAADYREEIFNILAENDWKIDKNDIKMILKRKSYSPFKKKEIKKFFTPRELWQDEYLGRIRKFAKDKEFVNLFWKLQGALIEADYISVGKWEGKVKNLEICYPFTNFVFDKKLENEFIWQKECEMCNSPFIIIKMPTGMGKTEGALLWAKNHNPKRIFYTLPVTFAINAMFQRFKKYFPNVGIYHHWADVFLDEHYSELLDNYVYLEHMLFPVQVTTPDQIILSFLRWKRWTVKLFSFLNSTFIFDEVHTYDPLLFSHFRILIGKLIKEFNAKIAIITATLPKKFQELEEFKDFIKLPENSEKYYKRRYVGIVKFEMETLEEWLRNNIKRFEDKWRGKKILIVVNTVPRAQKIFEILKNLKGFKVKLIHARFILRDRIKKEREVIEVEKNREIPIILVATQIVEISLDIDYDILLTEVAPIDVLIQRMGRINRKRKRNAEVIIFEVPSDRPYSKDIMKITRKWIKELTGRKSDFENMKTFNKYFNEVWETFSSEYEIAKDIWERWAQDVFSFKSPEDKLIRLIRKIKVIGLPAIPESFEEKCERIKEEARKYWERYRRSGKKKYRDKALENEREIRKFIVEVPVYLFKRMWFSEFLRYWIISLKYSKEKGLLIKSCNEKTAILI